MKKTILSILCFSIVHLIAYTQHNTFNGIVHNEQGIGIQDVVVELRAIKTVLNPISISTAKTNVNGQYTLYQVPYISQYPLQLVIKKEGYKTKYVNNLAEARNRIVVLTAILLPRNLELVFNGRTVDGTLNPSWHTNSWKVQQTSSGNCPSPTNHAGAEKRFLYSREFEDIIRQEMGIKFFISSISDRTSNRAATVTDNLKILKDHAKVFEREDNTMLIRNSLQIDRAYHTKKVGVLLYSQKHFRLNGNALMVRQHQEQGLSVFQLCYSRTTEGTLNSTLTERLGAGGYDDGRDVDPYDGNYGLTQLGREVVQQLALNHIMIDVSHSHEQTILETCALARQLAVQYNYPVPVKRHFHKN